MVPGTWGKMQYPEIRLGMPFRVARGVGDGLRAGHAEIVNVIGAVALGKIRVDDAPR